MCTSYHQTQKNKVMKKLMYLILSGMFVASVSTACNDETIKGNGNVKSESRTAQNFDKISNGGSIDVEITQGTSESVTVLTDENLLPYIITEVLCSTRFRFYIAVSFNGFIVTG